jgi:hypothetical protein
MQRLSPCQWGLPIQPRWTLRRNESRSSPHNRVFSLVGTAIRVRLVGRDVARWFVGVGIPRETSPQRGGTVEARGSRRGNACVARFHTMPQERVGVILTPTGQAFSSIFCN